VKAAIAVVIGLIIGFVAGIVLSEIIGIVGFVLTGRAVGIKYLSIYLALAFAVAAPWVRARIRRGRP
jgi:Family of unknown function (DUF5957)